MTYLKFLFGYGVRSIMRNPRRSYLLIGTVVTSVTVSIVARCFCDSVFDFWVQSTVESGTGHAQIHAAGYSDNSDTLNKNYLLPHANANEQWLSQDPEVLGYTTRINMEGIASHGEKSLYFLGMGIDPQNEGIVSPRLFKNAGDEGAFLDPAFSNGVVIGKGLSEILNLKVGDAFSLSAQTLQGSLNAVDVVVRGIMDIPFTPLSKRIIYLNIDYVRQFLLLGKDYSEIALRLKPGVNVEVWQKKYLDNEAVNMFELKTWWQIFPPMKKVEIIWQAVVGIVAFLLFLSSALSVLNIVFVMVQERTVEIGTLMAVGARGSQIKRIFAIEAFYVGLVGALLGSILGNAIVLIMGLVGVPLENPLFKGYIYIYPKTDFWVTIVVAILACAVCLVASIVPARKAAKVDPVVAFRGQIT